MSKLTIDTVQLGSSATATQNLVIKTNKDGTFTIARGNDGATSQDIVTIDANGKVLMPQSKGPKFYAYRTGNTGNLTSGVNNRVVCNTVAFDTHSAYDAVNGKFTAPVAGYYHFSWTVSLATTVTTNYISAVLFKNGASVLNGQAGTGQTGFYATSTVSLTLYLAAGDYVESFAYANVATIVPGDLQSRAGFSGHLVEEA
jgi:hypothetical protein